MARGDYSKISVDLKRRLIATWDDGGDYLAVAIVLGIKPATARSIMVRHQQGKPMEDQRGGCCDQILKVTDAVADRIVRLVEEQPDRTLKSISDHLRHEGVAQLSITSIACTLEGRLITTKKLIDCPVERNSQRTKAAREVYARWFMNISMNRTLVYVDGSSFTPN
jgi:hypothetical protein